MSDIKWTAIASDSWIILRLDGQEGQQIFGEGDTNISVETVKSEPGQGQMTGTITFTSEDGHLVRKVSVQRCGSDCGCNNIVPKPIDNKISFNWNESGEDNKKEIISIPACVEDKDSVQVKTESSDFTIEHDENYTYTVYPVNENTSDSPINSTINIKYAECPNVVVELVQDINGCSCKNVSVNDITIEHDKTANGPFLTIVDNNCFSTNGGQVVPGTEDNTYVVGDFSIKITYPDGCTYVGWFTINANNNSIVINANDANTDVDTKECAITVTYGKNCTKNVNVTQLGNNPCPTYNLTPNISQTDITCEGGTVKFTANKIE